MAVIQISKIQVRRGLQENLPQLSGGELGWSVDERRLWIGNGSLAEGAAEIGNTEILTANGDVLQAITTYSFKGDESGYTSITGVDVSSPVYRTLQHKIDERISVKDFGATGDGLTNDTAAVQRAFDQVYPKTYYGVQQVQRVIHFPAGVYLISGVVHLPPYAKIVGDGIESTIIYQNAASNSVFDFQDSLGQSGGNYGTGAAVLPSFVSMSDLTLFTDEDWDTLDLNSVNYAAFTRVRFQGTIADPITSGTFRAGVWIRSTQGPAVKAVFNDCQFMNQTYGVKAEGLIDNAVFNNCLFDTLYQGIRAISTGGDPTIKVLGSKFETINQEAIYSANNAVVTSAYNYFGNVGLGDGATLTVGTKANTAVLAWSTSNNYSIADVFQRTDESSLDYPTIDLIGVQSNATTQITATTSGTVQDRPGVTVSVANNSAANVAVFTSLHSSVILDYAVTRGSNKRTGTLQLSHTSGSNVNYSDEFNDTGAMGVVIDVLGDGLRANVRLYTDNSGAAASVNYAIRTFI